jgi:phosphohistidine phosphatase SixA
MSKEKPWLKKAYIIPLFMVWFLAVAVAVQAMPAQVIIIRHAEKYEDRNRIHLNPRGLTRARALAQFFQSDPRVREYGLPAAIIAQRPSKKKKSVRCQETVAPLARATGQQVITRFAYGEVTELVNWLRTTRKWGSKSVLICAQHADIVHMARALGVPQVGQAVWPHETYDRVWLIDFSPEDEAVTGFRNIPQRLLFGDAFQVASSSKRINTVTFEQTYSETMYEAAGPASGRRWSCHVVAQVYGDFSKFDEKTIPVLRLGGFTFGYYATTLGNLRRSRHAEVKTDAEAGSGSLRYHYKTALKGEEHTYATVSFYWGRELLTVEFHAKVDESKIKPDLNMPVQLPPENPKGLITGVIDCYLAFGDKRFYAPAGLTYQGTAIKSRDASKQERYEATLTAKDGIIVKKEYLPEL